jgi:hypothetical protein
LSFQCCVSQSQEGSGEAFMVVQDGVPGPPVPP